MVGQLRDLKQLAGEPAHQGAGAVAVIVAEIQLLHVPEQVPADIRLHQDTEGVAVIADDVGHHRPHRKRDAHRRHHCEKGLISTLGQQLIHAPAGDVGEGQIDQCNDECADHIQNEQPPMGLEIGQEDPQCGLLLIVFGGHGKLLSAGN